MSISKVPNILSCCKTPDEAYPEHYPAARNYAVDKLKTQQNAESKFSLPTNLMHSVTKAFSRPINWVPYAVAAFAAGLQASTSPDLGMLLPAAVIAYDASSIIVVGGRNLLFSPPDKHIMDRATNTAKAFFAVLTGAAQVGGLVARWGAEATAVHLNPNLTGHNAPMNATGELPYDDGSVQLAMNLILGASMALTFGPQIPALAKRGYGVTAAIRDYFTYGHGSKEETRSNAWQVAGRASQAAILAIPAGAMLSINAIGAIYGSAAMVKTTAALIHMNVAALIRDYGEGAFTDMLHNKSSKTAVNANFDLRIDIDGFLDGIREYAANNGLSPDETSQLVEACQQEMKDICSRARYWNGATCAVLSGLIVMPMRLLNSAASPPLGNFVASFQNYQTGLAATIAADSIKEATITYWLYGMSGLSGYPLQLKKPSSTPIQEDGDTALETESTDETSKNCVSISVEVARENFEYVAETVAPVVKNIKLMAVSPELTENGTRAKVDATIGEKASLSFQIRSLFGIPSVLMLNISSLLKKDPETQAIGEFLAWSTVGYAFLTEQRSRIAPMLEAAAKARHTNLAAKANALTQPAPLDDILVNLDDYQREYSMNEDDETSVESSESPSPNDPNDKGKEPEKVKPKRQTQTSGNAWNAQSTYSKAEVLEIYKSPHYPSYTTNGRLDASTTSSSTDRTESTPDDNNSTSTDDTTSSVVHHTDDDLWTDEDS